MVAAGGDNSEAPLAAGLNTMLLHLPLHTQLPPQRRRPVAGDPGLPTRMPCARSCLQTGVPSKRFLLAAARGNFHAPRQVFMIARDAHQQHPVRRCGHTDQPDQLVALNKGVLHFWHFAKYAVAFPRMSRSIITRAARHADGCSPSARQLPVACCWCPSRFQLDAP